MKANELRIGNWIIEDETIYSYGISKTKRQISLNDFRVSDDNWSDLWDMFKPIPLTEEILLKCGFEKDKKNNSFNIYKHKYYDLFFRIFDGGAISFCLNNEYVLIKYLHQLQNLYFALTNEELIVNL